MKTKLFVCAVLLAAGVALPSDRELLQIVNEAGPKKVINNLTFIQ